MPTFWVRWKRPIGQRSTTSPGEARADEIWALVHDLPIDIVLVKEPLAREAARIKAQHALSLADAFAVATARLHAAPVLTGDPEILALPRSVVAARRLER